MRRLLLILVLAVTILGSGGAGDGQSRELRIGLPRLPVVLDPATAQDGSDRFLYPPIFETLVRGPRGVGGGRAALGPGHGRGAGGRGWGGGRFPGGPRLRFFPLPPPGRGSLG